MTRSRLCAASSQLAKLTPPAHVAGPRQGQSDGRLEPDLERYYRDNVIGGPGAFVVAVDSFDHFGAAILKKLISEIAAMPAPELGQEARAR